MRLVGVIELRRPALEAPLSGRECAYYIASVTEYQEVIGIRHEGMSFHLRDEAGDAEIEIDDAEVTLPPDQEWRSTRNPRCAEFLARQGGRRRFLSPLLFRERIIAAGDRVAVFGHVRRVPDPNENSSYREAATRVVIQRVWIGKVGWAMRD